MTRFEALMEQLQTMGERADAAGAVGMAVGLRKAAGMVHASGLREAEERAVPEGVIVEVLCRPHQWRIDERRDLMQWEVRLSRDRKPKVRWPVHCLSDTWQEAVSAADAALDKPDAKG
jgi:hypothetical protein